MNTDFEVGAGVKVDWYGTVRNATVTSYSPMFDEYTVKLENGKEVYVGGGQVRSESLPRDVYESDLEVREALRAAKNGK